MELSARQKKFLNLEQELLNIEPDELVGKSLKINEIRQLIDSIAADGYITALITGETGTGKELAARLLHRKGWRLGGPFMGISLAAIAPSIIERELFGHEKGAFTDARERKPGYIEQAHKGILFLDDIDTIPIESQPKILRFLEERVFCRLSSTTPIRIDIQLIASTNQDLFQLVKAKKFREDLYYRINTMEVHLPALREHPEDIPLLADYFLQLLKRQGRTHVHEISPGVFAAMSGYTWPGNVRELRNCVEKAVLFVGFRGHERIELQDLPVEIIGPKSDSPVSQDFIVKIGNGPIDLEVEKAKFELSCIEAALQRSAGKKTDAWQILGLNDRFALRRRVLSLAQKYPSLVDSYSFIRKSFFNREVKD